MAQQEHYSLRWNNHQSHILRAFDSLLQTKTLVDVTLVCTETSIRAHKVVLSACSPFFQRVFSETPCKHPVIVLKDFRGWVVQAIVDFMYRGEISVPQERLQTLIHAGESLQVRGLVDHPVVMNTPTPAESPEDFSILDTSIVSPESPPLGSPNYNSTILSQNSAKLLIPPQVFVEQSVNMNRDRDHCTSPTPRRKQARPRRRSGECGPHDLSKSTSPSPSGNKSEKTEKHAAKENREMDVDVKDDDDDKVEEIKSETEEILDDDERPRDKDNRSGSHNDTPENLCTKKTLTGTTNGKNNNNDSIDDQNKSSLTLKEVRHRASSLHRNQSYGNFPPFSSLTPPPSFHLNNNPPSGEKNMKAESEDGRTMDDDSMMDQMDMPGPHMPPLGEPHHRMGNHQGFGKHGKDFLPNPLNFHPHFNQGDGPQRHPGSPLPFPPMPSVSALALTSPHSKSIFFSLS